MRRGGRVTSITAHTSPEGSHEAQGKAWQGNIKLAEERAAAAEEWVRAVIAEAGNGSIDAKAKVESAEEAELYTLRDEQGKDIEGRDLEQHSEAMFGISDEEDRHRQEVDEELKKGPKSGRARAEAVYKRLRRADIKVTRNESGVVHGTQKVPGKWRTAPLPAPRSPTRRSPSATRSTTSDACPTPPTPPRATTRCPRCGTGSRTSSAPASA